MDFAVLEHRFLPHARDYSVIIQDCLGADPGEHQLVFTHCVRADYETRVGDAIFAKSWDDVFCDFKAWKAGGEPDGFVWGVNWSNAYPGISVIEPSLLADEWSRRIGKSFYEIVLETNTFWLRLIFHAIRHQKLSANTTTISAVTIPVSQ